MIWAKISLGGMQTICLCWTKRMRTLPGHPKGLQHIRAGWHFHQAGFQSLSQSLKLGTNLTSALKTYAADMRQMRELAAQEQANKLPVQMLVLMLPALFLIKLTPIIIRFSSMD
jgi:hypothetical protein